MTHLALVRSTQPDLSQIDLFSGGAGALQARDLREKEQRELLQKLAEELTEMLDRLDEQIRADPSRAASSVAEYTGMFDRAIEELVELRDIDETFGSRGRRRCPLASLAERLEKGLNYLAGVFSVVATSKNVGKYNWKLVERDIQEVLAISRAISCVPDRMQERKAA